MKSVAILKRDVVRSGGLEKYASRIKESFQAKGCQVTLVSKEKLGSFSNFGKVNEYDAFCHQFIEAHPHDIVFSLERTRRQTHLRAGNGVHAAYFALRQKHDPWWKKLSLTFNPMHSTILSIEKESFESRELQKLFVNSFLVRDQILSFYDTDPKKIEVVHNGVEWKEMEAPFNAWPYSCQKEVFQFLFIGHNFERKGLRGLLQSLYRLPRRDFHLSVVGQDKNMANFEALAHSLGLEKNVSFWGAQSSILPFYQKADALVIPSVYDPFANVTLEALAMGLFVVSSKTNGGHEVITPFSGLTFDIGDLDAEVYALEEAMRRPKTQESSLAIRQSVAHLDFSHQLSHLCDLCLSSTI
jgi:UDP-glucose:(heptosyl)LPS alpha-1,3-glucosyltransferase